MFLSGSEGSGKNPKLKARESERSELVGNAVTDQRRLGRGGFFVSGKSFRSIGNRCDPGANTSESGHDFWHSTTNTHTCHGLYSPGGATPMAEDCHPWGGRSLVAPIPQSPSAVLKGIAPTLARFRFRPFSSACHRPLTRAVTGADGTSEKPSLCARRHRDGFSAHASKPCIL